MVLNIKNVADTKVPAAFIAASILKQLEASKRVLWLVSGGSSIAVAVEASKIISKYPHEHLTITLVDERYGPAGHKDSNWQKLISAGFNLLQAKLIPILNGENCTIVTNSFDVILEQELSNADYKIGLFGIGADGHTAGILPGSEVINGSRFVFSYKSEQFERITITPKTIEKLEEVVVYVEGEEKKGAIQNLEKEMDVAQQPAQILKKVPLLNIFTNFK